ncbi:MAG: family 14 glycosylhydrolase [Kangiellaceae bacterium]|nr:family 14 glycosylhydrolase [Kangiellaceae bacterium]
MNVFKIVIVVFCITLNFAQLNATQLEQPLTKSIQQDPTQFTANAMAPLVIETAEEWTEFKQQLKMAKKIGVNAISVDIWWGLVEKRGNDQFDWTYYDKIFAKIIEAKLHIVPIMSIHRCGGYEGDACNYPVPSWVWSHYEKQGYTKSDLMFHGENGTENDEFVSFWQDDLIIPQYIEFMSAFKKQYAHYVSLFDEINISLGPSGELRYPAYNPRDPQCAYPTRGCFQAYGKDAKIDFIKYATDKYETLENLNQAWPSQKTFKSFNEITPPQSASVVDGYASKFIADNQHFDSQYGRDFIMWYHTSLIKHGERLVDAAFKSFSGRFSAVPIGVKLAGIHWMMSSNAPSPRATEMAVGTIYATDNLNSRDAGYGYALLMKMLAKINQQRLVFLHFTNLEGDDADIVNGQKSYSMAKTQVNYVATVANDHGVPLKGENAMDFGVETHHGWDNIERSFNRNNFGGITILRINNVTENKIGRIRLEKFIHKQTRGK